MTSAQDASPGAGATLQRSLARELEGQRIVCFANDWSGDPTSKHHIMRTLAGYTDVLWVESSGMRRPDVSVADLKRIVQKLKNARQPRAVRTGPVRVISPLSLPFPGSRIAERINARLYERAVMQAGTRADATGAPLLWVYTPTVAPYLDRFECAGLVYHCVDRWWAFEEYDAEVMRRHHAELCRRADVVFASSAELVGDCTPYSRNVHMIRHGVDWGHFAAAALNPMPVPADLQDVHGPVIGFFGLIHDWIDQALIGAVADAFPRATVVLIGKTRVDVRALERRPNVRLLGQKQYGELPAYAARFDVGIIPFVVNELTLAVNPIKLREYMSAGLPVVSTALPELSVYAGHPGVAIAADAAGFVAAVAERLAAPLTAEERAAAARAMVGESWLGRCEEMVRRWAESRA